MVRPWDVWGGGVTKRVQGELQRVGTVPEEWGGTGQGAGKRVYRLQQRQNRAEAGRDAILPSVPRAELCARRGLPAPAYSSARQAGN